MKKTTKATIWPGTNLKSNLLSLSAINSHISFGERHFNTSIWKKSDKHTSCTSHSLHYNSSARLPQLQHSIIDETSSVSLICHSVACTRLWAATVVVEGDQLMPHEEK